MKRDWSISSVVLQNLPAIDLRLFKENYTYKKNVHENYLWKYFWKSKLGKVEFLCSHPILWTTEADSIMT